jgi:hypothetical protein
MTLRNWLTPPKQGSTPQDTLAWVRRMEIVCGVAGLAFGLQLWSDGWLHWLVIAGGLLCISPWPGARQILRRAERHPEILITDRERSQRRVRSFIFVWVPIFVVAATALGYAYGRWLGADVNFVLIGSGAVIGGWLSLKRFGN